MKYIIMADGKGSRWKNYRGMPKHLVKIKGETLLARTVRLIKELDGESEVIITSHDDRYKTRKDAAAIRLSNKQRLTEAMFAHNSSVIFCSIQVFSLLKIRERRHS